MSVYIRPSNGCLDMALHVLWRRTHSQNKLSIVSENDVKIDAARTEESNEIDKCLFRYYLVA